MTSPLAVVGLTWDGHDLCRPDLDIFFDLAEGLDTLPEVRGEDQLIPFRAGRLPASRLAHRRPVVANGHVAGPAGAGSSAAFRAYVDELKEWMDPTLGERTLVATLEDGSTRWITCAARNILAGEGWLGEFRGMSLEWEAVSDPLWHSGGNVAVSHPGIRAWWRLGERSGTVARDEVGRYPGAITGAPARASAGLVGIDRAGTFIGSPAVGGAPLTGDPLFRDTFDRADSDLGGSVAPTGQTWTMTGTPSTNGSGLVSSGMYVKGTAPTYGNIDLGVTPTRMWAIGSWTGDEDVTSLVLISSVGGARSPGGGAWQNMVHPVFATSAYVLYVYVDDTPTIIASHEYTVVTDGRPYYMGVEYDGDTITATCPDGVVVATTDPRIGTQRGRYLIYQIFEADVDDSHPRFHEVGADIRPAPTGSAVTFDGGSAVAVSLPNMASRYAVAGIFQRSRAGVDETLFSSEGAGSLALRFDAGDDYLHAEKKGTGDFAVSGVEITDYLPHDVVLVLDAGASVCGLYIDGTDAGATYTPANYAPIAAGSGALAQREDTPAWIDGFAGTLDEWTVLTCPAGTIADTTADDTDALAAAFHAARLADTLGDLVPTLLPIAWWPLDEATLGLGVFSPVTYRDTIMAMSPSGYWRLGELSGTVAASETGSNNGTYVNTPTLGMPGLAASDGNAAVLFASASHEGVEVPYAAGLHSASVSFTAMLKRSTTGVYDYLWWNGWNDISIWIYDADDRLYVSQAGVGVLCYSTPIDDTNAHHIVVTSNGAATEIYIDGVAVGADAAGTITPAAGASYIGANAQGDLAATLDEVAVWNRVLTPTEAADLYAAVSGLRTPDAHVLRVDGDICVVFDGANDKVASDLAISQTGYSIAVSVEATGVVSRPIAGRWTTASGGAMLSIDAAGHFLLTHGADYVSSYPVVLSGSPQRVVGTWDADSGLRLYVDGHSGVYAQAPNVTTPPGHGGSAFEIGYNQGMGSYFTGQIDEVMVWGRALTPDEVRADYAASLDGTLSDDVVIVPTSVDHRAAVETFGNAASDLVTARIVGPSADDVELYWHPADGSDPIGFTTTLTLAAGEVLVVDNITRTAYLDGTTTNQRQSITFLAANRGSWLRAGAGEIRVVGQPAQVRLAYSPAWL